MTDVESGTLELRQAADCLLDAARRSGASDAEVVAVEADELEAGVRLGRTEKLKRSRERKIALRTFVGHSSAVFATADLRVDALRQVAEACLAMARATAADPHSGLAEDADPLPGGGLDLYDDAVESLSAEEALRLAGEAESAALDTDPRISNSEGAEFSAGWRRLLYVTSRGAAGEYRTSVFSLSVIPVAAANGRMQRDYWYTAARRHSGLAEPRSVGRTAAERALRRLGARSVGSTEVPVVFDQETAASLLGHWAAAASGSSVYRGTSFLAGRLGSRVATRELQIVDDALLPSALGSRPFDAEGVPSRRNAIVEGGALGTYLLDSYAARKLGQRSTASAVRSLADTPVAGHSNVFVVAGATPAEEIVRSVRRGFYVTEVIGPGVNPVTGDYSRGAAGLWIENGELVFPVEEVTIAGNLLEMFERIEAIGSDLEFRSTLAAPTLLIGRMTVGGDVAA